MKRITDFLDKHGLTILILLIILSTCSTSMNKKRFEKNVLNELDSIRNEIKILEKEFEKEIKIEGLKAEKRMIQSTDRKILDVNRQSEIDKEINQIEK